MPDIHRGPPGAPMVFHISVGMTILIVTALRIVWRLSASGSSGSLAVVMAAPGVAGPALAALCAGVRGHDHRLAVRLAARLVGLVLYAIPLPMLTSANAATIRLVDGWHQAAEWALLVAVGLHVLAALAHVFIYRDRILQRMLPG